MIDYQVGDEVEPVCGPEKAARRGVTGPFFCTDMGGEAYCRFCGCWRLIVQVSGAPCSWPAIGWCALEWRKVRSKDTDRLDVRERERELVRVR